ncbi:MAG: MerR family transcriptional regulator [Saprospiraceae bacterium]
MAVYSIKDLEKLTGIKAHTLRVWEQRYNIIEPKRTSTNIRFYNDEDLRKVMNIALLNKNGLKISKIADLTPDQIQEKVAAISDVNYQFATQLDAMTLAVVEMDEFKFDRIIKAHIDHVGFEKAMIDVVYPFLDKLNLLWFTGSIAPVQESFITHLIRQKAILAIENLPIPTDVNAKKFVLFLPEGERQELTMLFIQFLIKKQGHKAIFLGNELSIGDLADAVKITKPDYIFSIITETFSNNNLQPFVNTLLGNFPEVELILTGYQVIAQSLESSSKLITLNSLFETKDFLEKLGSNTDDQPAPGSGK